MVNLWLPKVLPNSYDKVNFHYSSRPPICSQKKIYKNHKWEKISIRPPTRTNISIFGKPHLVRVAGT